MLIIFDGQGHFWAATFWTVICRLALCHNCKKWPVITQGESWPQSPTHAAHTHTEIPRKRKIDTHTPDEKSPASLFANILWGLV